MGASNPIATLLLLAVGSTSVPAGGTFPSSETGASIVRGPGAGAGAVAVIPVAGTEPGVSGSTVTGSTAGTVGGGGPGAH
mmetsp:Transcript_41134/g.46437  ORF Transcript_41134/g.46437 Transcript_41134/m.46437 type:complete len:80 (-) Transcript_41134:1204-1443(-)